MLSIILGSASCIGILAHEEKAFVSYMRETGKFFTGDEYHLRLGIYLSNKRYVQEHNAGKSTFKLGLNHLSHLTPAEYKALLGSRPITGKRNFVKLDGVAAAEVDWRTKGVVNPIKDQAQCGSCWAFATIAAEECKYAQTNHKLIRFSEQDIVDCDTGCFGCNGGWSSVAFAYIAHTQDGRIMLESDYPYTAEDGKCKFDKTKAIGDFKGADDIDKSEEALAVAATKGVVSVSIDASQESFHLYSSGIYYEPACSQYTDHAVAVVGYGSEGKLNYWIVRNSWGEAWGEKGYIRMSKDRGNNCAIASHALLPK